MGLATMRSLGFAFEDAWEKAWAEVIWPHDTAHRRQWKSACLWAREEYRAAYELMPTKHAAILRDFSVDIMFVEDREREAYAA